MALFTPCITWSVGVSDSGGRNVRTLSFSRSNAKTCTQRIQCEEHDIMIPELPYGDRPMEFIMNIGGIVGYS